MKYLDELKEAVCKELERYAKSGEVTVNNLDRIHKLTDIVKNIDKIEMLEGGAYKDDDTSHGQRRSVKRDGAAKEKMLDRLGEMMEDADPNEREALKRAMREIERA